MMPAMQAPAIRGPGPRFLRWLAAIAAGGLAVRLVYVLVLTPHLRGLGDATYYHELANRIADGAGFLHPGNGTPTALHPPLCPLLLALPSWLGLDSYTAHRLVVCLIGTGTIVVVGLVARRLAGERAGLIAAGLAAAYPTLISADAAVMSETLLGLLVALCMLAAYRLGAKPSMKRAAVRGVLVGLATVPRGEAIVLVPLLLFAVRRGKRLTVLAATVVVIAPW